MLPVLQDVATEREPWYGTQYIRERFSTDWLARWQAAAPPPQLHLPRHNPFIPTEFALLQARARACSGACRTNDRVVMFKQQLAHLASA